MEFADFFLLGVLLLTTVGTGAAFGTIAFFRMDRYRRAIAEQNDRIAQLEAILSGAAGPLGLPQPERPAEIEHAQRPALPAPREEETPELAPTEPAAPELAPPGAGPKEALLRPDTYRTAPGEAEPIFPRPPATQPPREPEQATPTPSPQTYSPPPPLPEADAESAPGPLPLAEDVPPAPPAAALPTDSPFAFLLNRMVMIWLGGGVIAAGLIGLLLWANEEGIFGQLSQLLLGYFIAGGAIAGAEVLRRKNQETVPADWQARHAPEILAAVGLICAFAISFVGYSRLYLYSPATAIGLMGAAALAGLILSLWQGRTPAWTGLLCGMAAPLMLTEVTAAPPALFAYLFAIGAAALTLAKHRNWLALGWAASAISLAWVGAWSLAFFMPPGVPAASAYLAGLAILGVAFAWDAVDEPADFLSVARLRSPWGLQGSIGMATVAGVAILLLALSLKAVGASDAALWALVALIPMLAAAAAVKEGVAPAPVLMGAVAVAALAATPTIRVAEDASNFAALAGALGMGASLGGWLMMSRNKSPAAGAILSALAPAGALLVAYLRLGDAISNPLGWGGVALALAALNGLALDRFTRVEGGAQKSPGAAAAFTAAAAACAVMAGAFTLDQVRLAAGVAVLLAPLAWLDRRLNIPALRMAGAVAGAMTVALLSPISLMRAPVEPAPLINSLAPTFILAILSVWAGARLFALGPAGYEGRVTVFLRGLLVALVLAFGWAEIRHLANAGVLTAPYTQLIEAGAHTCFLLTVAAFLAWRFGPHNRPLLHGTEILAFGVALGHFVMVGILQMAPWWGTEPATVPGGPILNAIAAAYLAPAVLFALYAWLRRGMGSALRAYLSAGGAFFAAIAWLILEIRRAFHPAALANAPVTPIEHASYSAAVIVVSALVLGLAMRFRGAPAFALRIAAAGLTAAGFAKALFVDAGFLDGPARYVAYAALTAAAIGAAVGYHRFVFPHPAPQTTADMDSANLIPPRP